MNRQPYSFCSIHHCGAWLDLFPQTWPKRTKVQRGFGLVSDRKRRKWFKVLRALLDFETFEI